MWGPPIRAPGVRPAKRLLVWIDDGSWFTQAASIAQIGFLVNDHALNLQDTDKYLSNSAVHRL